MMNFINQWVDGGMMHGNIWVIPVIFILVAIMLVIVMDQVFRKS